MSGATGQTSLPLGPPYIDAFGRGRIGGIPLDDEWDDGLPPKAKSDKAKSDKGEADKGEATP